MAFWVVVLEHRLERNTESRVRTRRPGPALWACLPPHSLLTSLHRDPSSSSPPRAVPHADPGSHCLALVSHHGPTPTPEVLCRGRVAGRTQRDTVSQGTGSARAGQKVRGQGSPGSWNNVVPGHKKARRSHLLCRRDPGRAGGWAGSKVPPPGLRLEPARILFPDPSPDSWPCPGTHHPPYCSLHTPEVPCSH